jgi:hypothetical protein
VLFSYRKTLQRVCHLVDLNVAESYVRRAKKESTRSLKGTALALRRVPYDVEFVVEGVDTDSGCSQASGNK